MHCIGFTQTVEKQAIAGRKQTVSLPWSGIGQRWLACKRKDQCSRVSSNPVATDPALDELWQIEAAQKMEFGTLRIRWQSLLEEVWENLRKYVYTLRSR